jgi:outer membrane immunogenic protein
MGENLCDGWCAARVAAAVEAIMRRLVCSLLLAGVAAPAVAGDNSWLRGSTTDFPTPHPYARWAGVYGGGQVGADFHGVSFGNDGNSTLSAIRSGAPILAAVPMQNLPSLDRLTTKGPSYGGFVGYNYQIDDVVLGIELNFNQAAATASASQSQFANPNQLFIGTITLNGPTTTSSTPPPGGTSSITTSSTLYIPTSVYESNTVTARLLDYGTVRIRGGWAYENFLPYVAVGVSVSRIDSTQTVFAHYVGTGATTTTTNTTPNPQTTPATPATTTVTHNPPAPVDVTYVANQTTSGKYAFGFSAALGIDYALTRNIFLRGEVEYLQLGTPSNITMNTASARVGGGLKF